MIRTITATILSAALFGLAGCSERETDEASQTQPAGSVGRDTLPPEASPPDALPPKASPRDASAADASPPKASTRLAAGLNGGQASDPKVAPPAVAARHASNLPEGQQGAAPPTAGAGSVESGGSSTNPSATADREAIWIEGEDATTKQVAKHNWYDDVRKDGMSGKQWLSHYSSDKPGLATYRFNAAGGEYTFWWRGNPLKSAASYSLADGEFVEIKYTDKRGEFMVSSRPDHRTLAWIKVGRVKLSPGSNTLTLKFHSKLSNHGGVDCMLFENTGFVPSGAKKPSEDSPNGPDDWFPVIYDDDPFSPRSVIDMSSLVESPAGKYGYLKRDGAALKFEKRDTEEKFWGCGANLNFGKQTRPQLTQRIKYLRKHGVKMIRQHPVFSELGPLSNGRFDEERLDEFDWWVAELKKHGIYSTWSVFYPLLIGPDDGYDPKLFAELARQGNEGLRSTSGLVIVERELQDLQLRYLEALLTHRNPYTGLRYVDDPALAVLEVHNEDSIFWHSPLNDLRDPKKFPLHSQRLRKRWFEWVKRKYGNETALKQAWGRIRPGDSFANGELALMGAYHLGGNGPLHEFKGQASRAADYIEFLTELQREFYQRRDREVRTLGFKAVTVTTAWRSGGPAADPANLYTDTAADMIDRHNYFGGGAGGHNIAIGDVKNDSHLSRPGSGLLSIGMYQVENRPFASTEWTQLAPNRNKLEAAPLIAFYGMGLQGWDASYHFLNSRSRVGDGWPNLRSYVTDTPHYIGQFPALAFAIHHGHIEEAPIVAARRLSRSDLFTGTDPLEQDFTGGTYDAKELQGNLRTPVETLAIGRVTVGFDGGDPLRTDVSAYWDESAKIVRSVTGQLNWDYGRRTVTLTGPKTQAIIGRAGGRRFDLPGVTVDVATPFVSLLFTPLDNAELARSKRILITAMSEDKQTGSRYSPDGKKLLALGGPPLLMQPVRAKIRLKGSKPTIVNVLDVYGEPSGQTAAVDGEGVFEIDGTHRTFYYEVRR